MKQSQKFRQYEHKNIMIVYMYINISKSCFFCRHATKAIDGQLIKMLVYWLRKLRFCLSLLSRYINIVRSDIEKSVPNENIWAATHSDHLIVYQRNNLNNIFHLAIQKTFLLPSQKITMRFFIFMFECMLFFQ